MDVREKLVEIVCDATQINGCIHSCNHPPCAMVRGIVDALIQNGVTVQEHGYWETVVEVRDNTVCGNGVKIEYKRCSCCKNPAKFFEDDFCGNCGAKLDLPQPPKGE